jgi:hypothetical protein
MEINVNIQINISFKRRRNSETMQTSKRRRTDYTAEELALNELDDELYQIDQAITNGFYSIDD